MVARPVRHRFENSLGVDNLFRLWWDDRRWAGSGSSTNAPTCMIEHWPREGVVMRPIHGMCTRRWDSSTVFARLRWRPCGLPNLGGTILIMSMMVVMVVVVVTAGDEVS